VRSEVTSVHGDDVETDQMKEDFEEVAEAVRVEYDENTDELYIVFKVQDTRYKQFIKQNWTGDISFRIINKKLVLFKE
jgi:hypothetical protein